MPSYTLALDKKGNFVGTANSGGNGYGVTESFGKNGGGTIFELSRSNGMRILIVLASLSGSGGPVASLATDAAGAIYGTSFFDGTGIWVSVQIGPGER